MNINVEHNLSQEELKKALAGMAIGSGIENELLETLSKAVCSCDDKTPKTPKHKATRMLYSMMQQEIFQAGVDIERYEREISAGGMQKAVSPAPLTAYQMQQLAQAIQDRYGFIGAQLQSVDYQPPADLLERWKQLGLVSHDVTPETFLASVSAEMHFIRSAYMMGKLIEAVEANKPYHEVMELVAHESILAPDLHAIAVAEQQTAMYLTDNAADLSTKIGQLAIKHRNDQIRQMAVDFHSRKLTRTTLDKEKKQAQGIATPDRPVETWQQFRSELHHALNEKDRDLDRLAYYEIEDAKLQGQLNKILEKQGPDALVYKMPLPTACPQCRFAYLQEDGKTPKLFKAGDLLRNGTNIGRKSNPVKGGKVVPGGRDDGAETLKPVSGLHHPWCACQMYQFTGYELFAEYYKKK